MRSFPSSDPPRPRRLALAALILLLAGCSGQMPTRPHRDLAPALTMHLRLSSDTGDPTKPITVTARVTNVGSRSLSYTADCIGSTPMVVIDSPNHDNIM